MIGELNGGERFETPFRCNADRPSEAAVNGALLGEKTVYPPDRLAMRLVRLQPQLHMNAPEYQNVVIQFDLACRFRRQPTI